ncbi:MAG TPA: D-alanyl-D-alanine carboxypeptidase [Stellaceae bacterium]|nr:D-alanyl-D-alanine carboxypeptidase [Stellaceae bacterium]
MRGALRRFVLLRLSIALAAALFLLAPPLAIAKTESYIVIDAGTGKTLAESNADAPAHPASLTKMMTLYLLFDALEKGKVTLDTPFTVSRWAASQAPSKLNLVAGQTVPVRDLILGIVTKSANDAAVTIAENLGGSEPAFAEMMTAKAHALGMTHTFYRDASGLPNSGQLTTARDLAKMALALYRDFPKEYHYFATEEFTYNGVHFVTHNHLMESFQGMDGIKTGYIRASGFNLAASAVRDNRRLIGIVLGGDTAHARDLEMARLLNTAFAGQSAPPVMTAEATDDADQQPSLTRRAAHTLAALSPVARAEAATPARVRHVRHEAADHWSIQVGAFAQQTAAEKAGAVALAKLPAKGRTVQVLSPGQSERYYRARIVSFSERDAERACRALHKKHLQCAVIAPGPTQQMAAAPSHRG